MTIDKLLISRLEELARLQLSEEEREELSGDLSNILSMVQKLEEVDTSGVAPLVYINNEENVLRTDEVKNQVDQTAAFKNAPDSDGSYFKVPKVISSTKK